MERSGTILRNLRLQKGLTQEKVADIFLTTQKRVSRIETGQQGINADEFLHMVMVLDGIKKIAEFNIDFEDRTELIRA